MKKLITLFLAMLMLVSVFVTGCKPTTVLVEGETYSDEIGVYNEDTRTESVSVYNTDIFYRNDTEYYNADPFVIRAEDETDPEIYGMYFLFGTTGAGAYNCFMSYDLVSWERYSDAYHCPSDGWEGKDTWAPEVIWDKNADRTQYNLSEDDPGTGVYFMFYTAGPSQNYYYQTDTARNLELGLAVATRPCGPYIMWNGNELGAVIDGVDYSKAENYQLYTNYYDEENPDAYLDNPYHGRKGDTVTNDDIWWNVPAMRASLSFQYANRDNAGTVVNGTYVNDNAAYMDFDEGLGGMVILDASPFIDPVSGDYYMYFSRAQFGTYMPPSDELGNARPGQSIYMVKMLDNDWSQPDYSTACRIVRPHTSFLTQAAADGYFEQAKAFDNSSYKIKVKEVASDATENPFEWKLVNSDVDGSYINEGPVMIYNPDTGLYHLMISTGDYGVNTYAVNQCIGYSPMGPFRKLTAEEGGYVLTVDQGGTSDVMSGVGHHGMVYCGDELIMIYHRQLDPKNAYHRRGPAADRVIWVTNDDGIPVMQVNGPSNTVQPKFYGTGTTEYDIISDEAEVSVDGKNYNDVSLLNDGVIPVHINETISPFVKEFEFTDDEITITFTFEDYRQIVSVMVYQSKDYYKTFDKVKLIEMDVEKDGKKGTYAIENLAYDWNMGLQEDDENMRAASNARAVFEEISVKEVRITIENIYDETVAIPEIYILGRPIA